MEYISSDTNVWLDFATINKLEIPFKLPYTYIMNEDAIAEELYNFYSDDIAKYERDNCYFETFVQDVEVSED